MSKYTVSHSCGHSQEHQLFGPTRDRDSKASWLETTLCTECWKAQQDKERAEKIASENARSAELEAKNNLPQLSGSEKQISWARSIRQQMIDSMEAFVAENNKPEWAAKLAALREGFAVVVLSHTDSRWFIDNRGFGTFRVAFGAQVAEWVKANKPEMMN